MCVWCHQAYSRARQRQGAKGNIAFSFSRLLLLRRYFRLLRCYWCNAVASASSAQLATVFWELRALGKAFFAWKVDTAESAREGECVCARALWAWAVDVVRVCSLNWLCGMCMRRRSVCVCVMSACVWGRDMCACVCVICVARFCVAAPLPPAEMAAYTAEHFQRHHALSTCFQAWRARAATIIKRREQELVRLDRVCVCVCPTAHVWRCLTV